MKLASLFESRPLPEYDAQKTYKEAQRLEALIKKQFHVNIELDQNFKDNGSFGKGAVTITANNNHFAPDSKADAGVFTSKAFNAAIDKDYREFRQKGWLFTQPVGAVFTIGVPK